jgi:DNA-binding NtrC family response regulator
MQTKLLRVLQDGEIRAVGSERTHRVNVRLIAATHRDLEMMVQKRTFREDLYYRLNVVTVRMPPLRERRSDIPLVVAHLLKKHAAGKKVRLTKAAMDRLIMFGWPGNVRQLENEVRRALVMCETTEGGDEAVIDAPDLSPELLRGDAPREIGLDLRSRVDALEADLLREALTKTQGNQTKAAELLGLSRFGLQKMMRRLKVATSKPS